MTHYWIGMQAGYIITACGNRFKWPSIYNDVNMYIHNIGCKRCKNTKTYRDHTLVMDYLESRYWEQVQAWAAFLVIKLNTETPVFINIAKSPGEK